MKIHSQNTNFVEEDINNLKEHLLVATCINDELIDEGIQQGQKIDALMTENTALRDKLGKLISKQVIAMNQEPAPVIDLLELREAVDAYNELDSNAEDLQGLPRETVDAFNEIVHAINDILHSLDPNDMVNEVQEVPNEAA